MSSLSRIVLMVRGGGSGGDGLARAVHFYQTVGLQVLRMTDDWAELEAINTTAPATTSASASPTIKLSLQVAQHESQLCAGYTPQLIFETPHLDTVVAQCVQAGGHLDGPIQFPAHGKVAMLRSPDGHMIGLYEPNVG